VTTGRESQVSVQHAVAAALVRGAAGIAEFSDACVNDAAVLALRRKVALARDEAIPTIAAQVEVVTADGACHALATRAARGSAQNPMSDRAIEDKLRACARNWRADYDPAPLIAAVWRLEDCADVTALLALTVPGS
jgi:2-methylcitrate dehydratase PrpD